MDSWPNGISAITLFVEDMPAAKQFYQEVFGLPVHYEDDASAVFDFGSTLVKLLEPGRTDPGMDRLHRHRQFDRPRSALGPRAGATSSRARSEGRGRRSTAIEELVKTAAMACSPNDGPDRAAGARRHPRRGRASARDPAGSTSGRSRRSPTTPGDRGPHGGPHHGVAGAGEILVSATVMDIIDGSGLTFEDAGIHELKGLQRDPPVVPPQNARRLSVGPGTRRGGSRPGRDGRACPG